MRALWKGALSFGLVHIPVALYSATEPKELKFKMLHKKDRGEIRYARICKADEKEIPWKEIVKGYELEGGNLVILTEEDFQKASPKKNRTIEVLDFTDRKQIDPIYYHTPYYLEPAKGAENAYSLLLVALKEAGKIAVSRFVFHHHEHIAAICPHKNILLLHQLRYPNEIRNFKELNIPKTADFSRAELKLALRLIEELSHPFNPTHYSDTYTRELKALIQNKSHGKKVAIQKEETPAKVHDILYLLKNSLKQSKQTRKRKAA